MADKFDEKEEQSTLSAKELKISFGENIKIARAKLGMRQKDLAEKLGVGQKYISSVELGKASISINAMAAIADALECNVIDMLSSPPPCTMQDDNQG